MTAPQLRIVRGSASAEEMAAVVAVLALVGSQPAAVAIPAPAAWSCAARLEAVGGRRVRSPADLRAF